MTTCIKSHKDVYINFNLVVSLKSLRKKSETNTIFYLSNVVHGIIYNSEKLNTNKMYPSSKEGDWLNIYFTLIKIMF